MGLHPDESVMAYASRCDAKSAEVVRQCALQGVDGMKSAQARREARVRIALEVEGAFSAYG